MFVAIKGTSGNDVLGDTDPDLYRFGLQRTINNAWNEANTGPYAIAVYRGRVNMVPGFTGTASIGEDIPNWGSLVPDSVLIAWYVN